MRPILIIPVLALGAAALSAAAPTVTDPARPDAQQCDAARDQRVLDVVAVEIRGALAGRATEAEIRARVVAAQERIRTSGALSCGTATTEYGAIAVSSRGAWGVSWSHTSQGAAEERALRECASSSCRVMVRVVGPACGAYARGNNGFGWGTDVTREGAQNRALSECQRRGSRCRVIAYACNSRPG